MSTDTMALAKVVLFADLSPDELGDRSQRVRRRRYSKGETIFLRGDPGSTLFVVEPGSIRIALTSAEGKEMTLAILGPGDFFGEITLLDGEPRSADAVSQELSYVLLLERAEFLKFLEERPRVAANLIRVLSQRLRRDAQIVQDAAFLDVPARLARPCHSQCPRRPQPARWRSLRRWARQCGFELHQDGHRDAYWLLSENPKLAERERQTMRPVLLAIHAAWLEGRPPRRPVVRVNLASRSRFILSSNVARRQLPRTR
jgi:CRP-like cAMP-binding protein